MFISLNSELLLKIILVITKLLDVKMMNKESQSKAERLSDHDSFINVAFKIYIKT